MKEHKSELQQKVITLEHALNQARYELSERAVEVRHSRAFFCVFVVFLCVCVCVCAVFANRKSDSEEKIFTLKGIGKLSATTKTLVDRAKEFNSL